MSRLAALSACALLFACAAAPAPPPEPAPICPVPERDAPAIRPSDMSSRTSDLGGPLLLRNARLIDGSGGAPQVGVDVLVTGDRITTIGKALPAPDRAVVIDLGGRTLLPGFIDAHTHLLNEMAGSHAEGVMREVQETDADLALRGVANARATLLAGFTTVRDVGGTFAIRSLRDAIATGKVTGPRILAANHAVGITGGHCDDTNGLRPDVFGAPDFRVGIADGASEARKAVRHQIKLGADVIKVCATGGVLSSGDGAGDPQLTPAELEAIVDEATRAGRKVAAHAHGTDGIKDAVRAGVHSIEHGSLLDAEAIALMKKRGTFLVPTVYVGRVIEEAADAGRLAADSAAKARFIAPRMRDSFSRAVKAGVKIAFGTDAGVFPHGNNAREFAVMVDLGMTPSAAIVAATRSGAELLGLRDLGQVKAGFIADLVVVDGDPLADIRATERPLLVIQAGRPVRPPAW